MNRITPLAFLAAALLGGCGAEEPRPAKQPPAPAAQGAPAAPAGKTAADCSHRIHGDGCPFCHADLVEKGGECVEHGVPEALCWICRPALVAAYRVENDWCGGHGLPESQCGECNPGKGEAHAKAVAASAAKPPQPLPPGDVTVVPDPDAPRSRRAPSVTCATERVKVRLASAEVAAVAGFKFETVKRRKALETLAATAELTFVPDAYARVAARVGGVLRKVNAELGAAVEAGDVLAVVEAPELGSAKSGILQALDIVALREKNLEREKGLVERGVGTLREVVSAETALAEAKVALTAANRRLRDLGVREKDVAAVAASKDTSALLNVVAPLAGRVVERDAVVGESVDTARTLFAVADTKTLWAMLDVREADAGRLMEGQTAVIRLGGSRGERVAGLVEWVSPRVEPATRTVRVRIPLPNPDGALRAGAFGTAELTVGEVAILPAVPKAAVQWEGCCNVAFVRKSDTEFQPRKLRLGADLGDHYAVISGLSEGEAVVTEGSFLLRTEIRRDSIGAGCCEGH